MATLTVYPSREVRQDATAYLTFYGPPNVSLEWNASVGSIDGAAYTDEVGKATALYTPGVAGTTATITVTHGT
jgi:hypothetical protein